MEDVKTRNRPPPLEIYFFHMELLCFACNNHFLVKSRYLDDYLTSFPPSSNMRTYVLENPVPQL